MKPIFGFLWPERRGPLDEHARQTRMLRIPGRGPLRITWLLAITLFAVPFAGSVVLGAMSVGWFMVILSSVVLATLIVLILRAWVVGTYVNDDGFAIQRMFRADVGRWADVWQCEVNDGTLVLRLVNGQALPTLIRTSDLDFLGRPTAFDMAVLRFERWREGR